MRASYRECGRRVGRTLPAGVLSIILLAVAVFAEGQTEPPADAQPFWRYTTFGEMVGRTGIAIAEAPGTPFICTSGTLRGVPLMNDFWQAIRYNPVRATYETVFVSDFISQGIDQITVGNVAGDSTPEIVLHDRFRVFIYSQPSMTVIAEFEPIPSDVIQNLVVQDLDWDGYDELIINSREGLKTFGADGQMKLHLPGVGGYVFGQFDNDPAIEVVNTIGTMVDLTSRSVEWEAGFPYYATSVSAADVNGDGVLELIQTTLNQITCWDALTRTAKWSYTIPHVSYATPPTAADLNGDGRPELLCPTRTGLDALNGSTGSLVRSYTFNSPEVFGLKVADVDADGQQEFIWAEGTEGGVAGSRIRIADVATGDLEWKSPDFTYPFTNPVIGDVDGDGRPDLVFAARTSYAYPWGARVLVFDAETLRQKAVSEPLESHAWDLKLGDLDGDGKMEMLVASFGSGFNNRGIIVVLGLTADGSFITRYRLSDPTDVEEPFSRVDAADVDGDGRVEVIGCGMIGSSQARDVRLYVFDPFTGLLRWRSSHMRSAETVQAIRVTDLEGDGRLEIVCLLPSGDLFVFDAVAGELKTVLYGAFTSVERPPTRNGLMLGDIDGNVSSLVYEGGRYGLAHLFAPGPDSIDGITYDDEGYLWISSAGSISLWTAPFVAPLWKTAPHKWGFLGEEVATVPLAGEVRMFVRSPITIEAYSYAPPTLSGKTGDTLSRPAVSRRRRY